jgi:hypothetical protein
MFVDQCTNGSVDPRGWGIGLFFNDLIPDFHQQISA